MSKRVIILSTDTDGNFLYMDTEQVARIFGCREGYHPIIYSSTMWITAAASEFINVLIDPIMSDPLTEGSALGGPNVLNIYTTTGWDPGTSTHKKTFTHFGLTNSAWRDVDHAVTPMHLWNKLVILRANAATTFTCVLEYDLVPGSLRWDDEWAELLDDKTKVDAIERAAGSEYFQVGDYYQIGKRRIP